MTKPFLILLLVISTFKIAFAQKTDSTVFYLKDSGEIVSKDSADFYLIISHPNTNINKKLYIVKEFYKDGKIRVTGTSLTNSNLVFQGPLISFFHDGQRMSTINYDNGQPVGDELEYYPNGKVYNIKRFAKNGKMFLVNCNDSAGIVLAVNGNGKWLEFNKDFTKIDREGRVENGVEDGLWRGRLNDSIYVGSYFYRGKLLSSANLKEYKATGKIFANVDSIPGFKGGMGAFWNYLGHMVHYPATARESNAQGVVYLGFVVEENGELSNIQVLHSVGYGIDEEAIRVIKLSPPWNPAILAGKPVRAVYIIPISFKLAS